MVATYRSTQGAVAFAASKSMLDIFNANTATRKVKVYRCYQFNNGTTAVTGVLTTMQITRTTAASAGTAVTPVKHDTASANLEAAQTSGTNRTVTATDIFRRYVWSNDEPVVSGATLDEWELLVPFAEVFMSGYGDSNVEPIVCNNSNEGLQIAHTGATAVGTNDFEIEFTCA